MKSMINENERLIPRGRVLWEIEARMKNMGMVETGNNMHQDLMRRAFPALEKCENWRRSIRTPEELKQYQDYVRDTFIESIGGLPSFDTPLNPQVRRVQEVGGFIVENVIFESRPHVYVTCNLYRPLQQEGPVPGILIPLGHTDEGKYFDEYQRAAQMLVKAGFVVLTMDPVGEGERFEHFEPDIDFEPIQGCSGEHDLLDWKCKLMGQSLARYFVHDGMRGLEYLASRPEVDASRLAVTGHSGGGTQTSMLMCAAADRIAAAAPCSYTTDLQAMIEYGKDPDNEMIWPGVIRAGIDYADIISVMAPKPVLLLTNRYDFFPRGGVDRTLERIRSLWSQVGAKSLPEIARTYTGHSYTQSLAEAVAHFFALQLTGRDVDLGDFEYRRLDPSVLQCTASGQVVLEFPDLRTVQTDLTEQLAELTKQKNALEPALRKERAKTWLAETVQRGHEAVEPHVRVNDEGVCAHYIYRVLVWRAQEGYFNNGVLLRDMRRGDQPLPTVIALWPKGTQAIELHSNWIHRQCAAGRQVLIIDTAAVASCEPHKLSNSNMYIGWSTLFTIQSYLIELGDSIAALRIFQAMQALKVVPDLPMEQDPRFTFYGEDDFAFYAKVAGWLTGTPVETSGCYQTFAEIVTEKYHDQTHTMDWVLPGVLQYLDMEDIDSYLREDGLMI